MFDGCSPFDVDQPYQQSPRVNNPSETWLHTPPSQMPWSLPVANQPAVMRFTADSSNTACPSIKPLSPECSNLAKMQSKRKSWDCEIEYNAPPTKQLITEEKMAENLNGLHISNSYVSHQIGSNQPMSISLPESLSPSSPESVKPPALEVTSAGDSTLEGKDHKVSLCEQLRKLISETSVIPSSLLNKVERPCNALVLWQPPGGSILKTLKKEPTPANNNERNKTQQKENVGTKPSTSARNFLTPSTSHPNWDDLMDNNNSTNAMDLNLFSSQRLSSQPLPSEVPLPDDDLMDENSQEDFMEI